MSKTPYELANQMINEMAQAGLTPDDMLRIIGKARKRLEQMQTENKQANQ